ncbi:MAG TPA: RNA polymerase sigma factor [Pyrinomonadaceae bacterium]|jgi:RNA polymerase sigma factor (sigma-70 family)
MSFQQWEEVRFYWRLMEVLDGRKPPDVLVEDDVYLKRGGRICRSIARGTSYDPQDMFQDVCVRILLYFSKSRQDNDPEKTISFDDVNAFFKFYVTVAGNLLTDYFRKHGKRQNQEVSLSANIADALTVAAPGLSPYAECFFKEFAESLKRLPEHKRRAVELRQEGYSYEEIAVTLNRERIKCTKVAVRNWVMEALAYFTDSPAPRVRKVAGL